MRVSRCHLFTKLVAWKAKHFQAPVFVLFVELFEPGELRRETTFGRGVNNQQHLALKVADGFLLPGGGLATEIKYAVTHGVVSRLRCALNVWLLYAGADPEDHIFAGSPAVVCSRRSCWLRECGLLLYLFYQ